jgi:hypothetical protein
MLATRLLQRIEQHWDAIARAVVEQARTDPNTPHHRLLDDDEVHARARELLHALGVWLTSGDEAALVRRCREIGKQRHTEGVLLAEIVYKLLLIERKTVDYVQTENVAQTSVQIYAELEMVRALQRFFAIVIHSVVAGYEQAAINTRATSWSRQTAA